MNTREKSEILDKDELDQNELLQVVGGSNGNFPPGQFPSGNSAHAPGQSNPNWTRVLSPGSM